jgi:hypothetical protein
VREGEKKIDGRFRELSTFVEIRVLKKKKKSCEKHMFRTHVNFRY